MEIGDDMRHNPNLTGAWNLDTRNYVTVSADMIPFFYIHSPHTPPLFRHFVKRLGSLKRAWRPNPWLINCITLEPVDAERPITLKRPRVVPGLRREVRTNVRISPQRCLRGAKPGLAQSRSR
jgi:hypothetical protein